MIIFVFVITGASTVFMRLLSQFKQQSKIAESNIEGSVGLDLLRRDISNAGYGLPWTFQSSISYNEAAGSPANNYNDSPGNVPRAIICGNDASYSNIVAGSDYLVIKLTNVGGNSASDKWTITQAPPFTAPYNPRQWTFPAENFINTDVVTVVAPGPSGVSRSLVMSGSTFYTIYQNVTSSPWASSSGGDARIVYGIAPGLSLRMPFNRADYFISNSDVPQRCAPNTGVLVKGVMKQSDGNLTLLPLFDCVADMQVIYGLDMNDDGVIGTCSNADGSTVKGCPPGSSNPDTSETFTAAQVQATLADPALLRNRLKEIRIYILAHEGQFDPNYTHSVNPMAVEDYDVSGLGSTVDLSSKIGGNWQNYRWKVYRVVVKPNSLG